jgi:hypothetical protein
MAPWICGMIDVTTMIVVKYSVTVSMPLRRASRRLADEIESAGSCVADAATFMRSRLRPAARSGLTPSRPHAAARHPAILPAISFRRLDHRQEALQTLN